MHCALEVLPLSIAAMARLYYRDVALCPSKSGFYNYLTFGNDKYNYTVHPLTQPTRVAAEQLCVRMQSLSKRQSAVVGGSSSTWEYKSWMQPRSLDQFDANSVGR